MIVLANTTDKIQLKLSNSITSNQLEGFASYRDTTTTTITPGRNFVLTNNTTAVDLIGSPNASTQRVIDYMSVYNSDTVAATVSFIFNDNSTLYELSVTQLQSGEKIEYAEGSGFKSFDINGHIKKSTSGEYNAISGWNYYTLTNDVTNSNSASNSIADVTGFSFSVTANKTYWFQFILPYTASVSTTGCRFSITGATISSLYYVSKLAFSTTVETYNGGLGTYDLPAAASTQLPTTLSGIAVVEGIATFTSSGYLISRFASEVSNSPVTAKAGSVVYYKQLN